MTTLPKGTRPLGRCMCRLSENEVLQTEHAKAHKVGGVVFSACERDAVRLVTVIVDTTRTMGGEADVTAQVPMCEPCSKHHDKLRTNVVSIEDEANMLRSIAGDAERGADTK